MLTTHHWSRPRRFRQETWGPVRYAAPGESHRARQGTLPEGIHPDDAQQYLSRLYGLAHDFEQDVNYNRHLAGSPVPMVGQRAGIWQDIVDAEHDFSQRQQHLRDPGTNFTAWHQARRQRTPGEQQQLAYRIMQLPLEVRIWHLLHGQPEENSPFPDPLHQQMYGHPSVHRPLGQPAALFGQSDARMGSLGAEYLRAQQSLGYPGLGRAWGAATHFANPHFTEIDQEHEPHFSALAELNYPLDRDRALRRHQDAWNQTYNQV